MRKNEVLLFNRRLTELNLVIDTFGNCSSRNNDRVYIKPSGVNLDDTSEEQISELALEENLNQRLISGLKPSSDTPTHLELYQAFPEIGGIVHTHSLFATAWAQAAIPIPCYGTTHADFWQKEVPVTRKLREEEINGDYEIQTGKVIVETLKSLRLSPLDCPGILVAHHGPFTWGASVEDAVKHAELLEYVARLAMITKQINHEANVIDPLLHQRHFSRKHGPNAYYGQTK